jgi:ribosomal protein S25
MGQDVREDSGDKSAYGTHLACPESMIKHPMRFVAVASVVSMVTLGFPAPGTASPTHAIEQKGQAKGQDKGKGDKSKAQGRQEVKSKDKSKDKVDTTRVVVVDRDGHDRVVREYVTRGNLPPGLAKRRALPPGLAKQLRENGELPPGLQTYFTPIPQEVDVRFPALPVYYHRYFAGNDFVVVDTRTNRVVLLIRDLLR